MLLGAHSFDKEDEVDAKAVDNGASGRGVGGGLQRSEHAGASQTSSTRQGGRGSVHSESGAEAESAAG